MYSRGNVVFCKSGRDKSSFLVVTKTQDNFVYLANGKRRKLEDPKKKNKKHISATKVAVDEHSMENNRRLRRALTSFNKECECN